MDTLGPFEMPLPPKEARRWMRPILVLTAILGGAVLVWGLGLHRVLQLDNLARLQRWVAGYGPWAPLLYIVGYVLLEMAFVPALPLTVLGGLVFGPLWGTAYVWVAATTSAALAFLLARYAARGTVERWVARNPRLARMDAMIVEHGWRILMITRLVPIFPFNLQNFAYGLTRIGFGAYLLLSWLCMLPGTVAYTFAAGALSEGGGGVRQNLTYLGIAGVLLVLLSLLPNWLRRRSRIAKELL